MHIIHYALAFASAYCAVANDTVELVTGTNKKPPIIVSLPHERMGRKVVSYSNQLVIKIVISPKPNSPRLTLMPESSIVNIYGATIPLTYSETPIPKRIELGGRLILRDGGKKGKETLRQLLSTKENVNAELFLRSTPEEAQILLSSWISLGPLTIPPATLKAWLADDWISHW